MQRTGVFKVVIPVLCCRLGVDDIDTPGMTGYSVSRELSWASRWRGHRGLSLNWQTTSMGWLSLIFGTHSHSRCPSLLTELEMEHQ